MEFWFNDTENESLNKTLKYNEDSIILSINRLKYLKKILFEVNSENVL